MVQPSYAQQVAGTPGQVFSNVAGLLFASNFNEWSIPEGTTPTNSQIQWPNNKMCQPTSGGTTFQAFAVGSPITIVDANTANSENVIVTNFNSNTYGCQIQAVMTHTHYSYRVQSATSGLQEAINYASGLPYQVVVTPDWARAGGITSQIVHAQGNYNVTILDQRSSVIVPYLWNGTIYVAQPFGGQTLCGSGGQIQGSDGTNLICDPSITLNTSTHGITAPVINGLTWPTNTITIPGECLTGNPNGIGTWSTDCINPNNPGFQDSLGGGIGTTDSTFTLASSNESGFGIGYLFIDTEWIYYTSISGSTVTVAPGGRGCCGTTAANHSNGAGVFGALSGVENIPAVPYSPIVGSRGAGTQVMGINNPFPSSYNALASLVINNGSNQVGSNSTVFDIYGGIHQLNTSTPVRLIRPYGAQPSGYGSEFAAPIYVGANSVTPITDTTYVIESNVSNQFTQAQSFGAGIAGPVTTIQAATVGAPLVTPQFNGGSTTWSYVCVGVDSDGNTFPGATGSTTIGAATLSFPGSMQILCPPTAGAASFNVYRTAGGPNVGLLLNATVPYGYAVDTGANLDGTFPPGTNNDVPRLCNNNGQFCILSGSSGTPPLTCTSGRMGWEYHNISATTTPFVLHCVNGSSWTTAY